MKIKLSSSLRGYLKTTSLLSNKLKAEIFRHPSLRSMRNFLPKKQSSSHRLRLSPLLFQSLPMLLLHSLVSFHKETNLVRVTTGNTTTTLRIRRPDQRIATAIAATRASVNYVAFLDTVQSAVHSSHNTNPLSPTAFSPHPHGLGNHEPIFLSPLQLQPMRG
ncbi:unnamed protein product [Microthlaspi erraticum]|uniref:Uncharacterized protein n=1 Tax=Microthlaspi erraticum TaxID=1685480 RepID=A0A6D2JL72_9BRAS|nr:unnamed protein product [Microthlaspi erraticum]